LDFFKPPFYSKKLVVASESPYASIIGLEVAKMGAETFTRVVWIILVIVYI